MSQDADISWQFLGRIVREWKGSSAELAEVVPLVGVAINTTLGLALKTGERAVLKISPHRVNREHSYEAYQLQLLHDLGLPVPQVYACHLGSLDQPASYVLMEFVEGVDLARAKQACSPEDYERMQVDLAGMVARMHATLGDAYQRLRGSDAPRFGVWPEFYRSVYEPIWQEVVKAELLPPRSRKVVNKVHDRLDKLLANDDPPRLVHWDLWSGNVMARQVDGRWQICAILDPNCKYAHHEAEIAYMELFHTCTPVFLKAYQATNRLPQEYHQVRKPVYHLYEMLNHLLLFGHEYDKPTRDAVERVAALV